MESPALLAINGNAIDEGIFDNEMNMEAAVLGVDDVDKEDINSSMAHTISEEDDMEEENYIGICNWQNFPPASNSCPKQFQCHTDGLFQQSKAGHVC